MKSPTLVKATLDQRAGKYHIGLPKTFNDLVPGNRYFCMTEEKGRIILTPKEV